MNEIIKHLNEMLRRGIISDYALGGATALVYYFEPVQTQDVDLFIILPHSDSVLVNLSSIYSYLAENEVEAQGEYVLISGIPVQFLVPYNALIEEAVKNAQFVNFMDLKVRVPSLEYLMVIMVQTGRGKDKARLEELFKCADLFSLDCFEDLLEKFSLTNKWLEIKKWIN